MAQVPFPFVSFQFPNTMTVANGYLTVHLNKDCKVIDPAAQLGSRIKIKVPLNNGGEPSSSVLFWPNDQLNPGDSVYIYSVFASDGQLVLGPMSITIPPGGLGNIGFGQAFGSSFGS